MFILVSNPQSPFSSHGHKLLIVAPIVEGLLGGWSTLQSTTSAYISDCTSSGSRASVFSRFGGVFFFGFSMGPAIGGWIIRNRIGLEPGAPKSVAPVFYLAALFSLLNCLLVLFVFPESLSKEKQESAQREYRVEHSAKGKGRDPRPVPDTGSGGETSRAVHEISEYKRPGVIRSFLSPLAVFLPAKVADASGTKTIDDWSLTFLAAGLFATVLATVSFHLYFLRRYSLTFAAGYLSIEIFICRPYLWLGCRATQLLYIFPWRLTSGLPSARSPP